MAKDKVPGFPCDGWVCQSRMLAGGSQDEAMVRSDFVTIALSCVGLKSSDPVYYDGLYPWDVLFNRIQMASKQSKCALTVLMILRAAGFDLPSDGLPYAWSITGSPKGQPKVPGAIAQVCTIPGWKRTSFPPKIGDCVVIHDPSRKNREHAFVVVGYEDDGHTLVSVDGGTGPVKQVKRSVVSGSGKFCLHDKACGVREMLGFVDLYDFFRSGSMKREFCLPARKA